MIGGYNKQPLFVVLFFTLFYGIVYEAYQRIVISDGVVEFGTVAVVVTGIVGVLQIDPREVWSVLRDAAGGF
jgi:hypothetical protein